MKKIEHTSATLPPLTQAQKVGLERLAALPDDQINRDGIPELTDEQLAEMSPDRPLAERIAALQHEADKLGPADPHFDQKKFSDEMWGWGRVQISVK